MSNTERPTWDEIWMRMAKLIAERSIAPNEKQVGAVIVSEDNTRVLALGYNGDEAGGPHEFDSLEPGQSGFIHAEENALIKADYNFFMRKKLYVTTSPCRKCCRSIINGKIDEVIFCDEYRDTSGLELLKRAGVKVRQFRVG